VQLCSLNQELRIVNPLSSGKDFFSTHEHVVAVAVPCICGVWHCIEGSHRKRELVEDEEVSVVFGFHQAAEKLFTGSGQVLFIAHLHSGLPQHLHCLRELQSKGRIEEPEWLMGELSRHSLDLVLEVVPQPPKDACEQIPNSVNHLMVMIFERHLQVEAHELCEMSVCVGIFGTEDSTHSEHLVEVGGDGHLLVQLRRLREEGGALEVGRDEEINLSCINCDIGDGKEVQEVKMVVTENSSGKINGAVLGIVITIVVAAVILLCICCFRILLGNKKTPTDDVMFINRAYGAPGHNIETELHSVQVMSRGGPAISGYANPGYNVGTSHKASTLAADDSTEGALNDDDSAYQEYSIAASSVDSRHFSVGDDEEGEQSLPSSFHDKQRLL